MARDSEIIYILGSSSYTAMELAESMMATHDRQVVRQQKQAACSHRRTLRPSTSSSAQGTQAARHARPVKRLLGRAAAAAGASPV